MEDALRRAYFNVGTGFGSIAKTYTAAKAFDARVTLAATREFLAKQEGRQKVNRRTDNSCVAPGPRETVQVDLADFQGFGPPTEFRYALVGVDVFTKLAFAKPVKGNTPKETAAAMEDALKTYGLVKHCYTDLGDNSPTHSRFFSKRIWSTISPLGRRRPSSSARSAR